MKLSYINQVKANISIYTDKKTTNILDGTYKSVYKGKSMNFENLRQYVLNDEIKDIDWKSSARSGELLVKEFIAEKKHNIMLIMDSGPKMEAVTDTFEIKKELALIIGGTLGYIAIKNNDFVAMTYINNQNIVYKPFKYTLSSLDNYLSEYDNFANIEDGDLNILIESVFKNITKKMIIFIITDLAGIDEIKSKTLKMLKKKHDVLIIGINDAYMHGDQLFDISSEEYIPSFLLQNKKLWEVEKEIKKDLITKNKRKLKSNSVAFTTISSQKEINTKIIQLLEEHKYARIKN